MSMGLLGAVAGAGGAISEVARTMFNVQIEKDREARLQAIEDKRYARSRADSLADYQRTRTDQLADTASQREFQKGLLRDERAYQDTVRDTEAGYVVSTQVDDGGNLIGVTRSGSTVDLKQLETVDPLLTPALRALESAQAEASRLGVQSREDNPAVWDRVDRATQQFNNAFAESQVRLGRESGGMELDIGQFGGEAPPEALELLRSNPTLDIKMQFLQRYGYLPAL
jgi:hypothetical protein